MSSIILSCLLPWFLSRFFSFCLQIKPTKRTKSSVATPARKHTRRVKSSQGSAVVDEQPQPNTLFISPSLPIDARVSAKLRAKILKNEFIEFGALATNPVLESKFQVVLQSSLPSSAMSLLVISLNFTRVVTALDVPLSIPVPSVRVPTE